MLDQKGNALFLILIAVALFAALSYAVTQSGRGGSGIDKEQAELVAAKLFNFTTAFQTGVDRLRLGGCDVEEISFANDVYRSQNGIVILYPDGHNPNTPVDGRCELFKETGVGVTPLTMDQSEQVEWNIGAGNTGYESIRVANRVAMPGVGTALEDLIILYTYIPNAICRAINLRAGVPQAGTDIPLRGGGLALFHGVFPESAIGAFTQDGNVLSGFNDICAGDGVNEHNNAYFSVLVAR